MSSPGQPSPKLPGNKALLAALAIPAVGYAMMRSVSNDAQQDQQNEMAAVDRTRAIEALRNSGDIAALRGNTSSNAIGQLMAARARQEVVQPTYDDYPMELFKEGRRVGTEIGRMFAKAAGIGGMVQSALKPVLSRTPGLGGGGWKAKALVGGTAIAGGYGALQGGKALYNAGNQPARVKAQGAGPALPRYVNQWGQST